MGSATSLVVAGVGQRTYHPTQSRRVSVRRLLASPPVRESRRGRRDQPLKIARVLDSTVRTVRLGAFQHANPVPWLHAPFWQRSLQPCPSPLLVSGLFWLMLMQRKSGEPPSTRRCTDQCKACKLWKRGVLASHRCCAWYDTPSTHLHRCFHQVRWSEARDLEEYRVRFGVFC